MAESEPLLAPREAVTASKQPPPETTATRRNRIFVIGAFWSIVILLGIPVWLWTTSIYRARLPLDQMLAWAEGKACKPSFPLHITIEAPELARSEALHLIQLVQSTLDDDNEFAAHHLRLKLAGASEPKRNITLPADESLDEHLSLAGGSQTQPTEALTVQLISDASALEIHHSLLWQSAVLEVRYPPTLIPSTTASASSMSKYLATELEQLFSEERAIFQYMLETSSSSSGSTAQSTLPGSRESRLWKSPTLSSELIAKLAQRENRSLKYATTYHLTFSLFTPSASPSQWEIEAAIENYLGPLLRHLSVISNFKVDTQVQLYAKFAPSTPAPEFNPDANVWTLRNEDLSSFINAAEWPLSPSTGAGPTLNFLLYVPGPSSSPLVVRDSHAAHWLIPQWGGVMIQNQGNSTSQPETLSEEELRPAMLIFSQQLLSLLGAPQTPSSLALRLQTLVRVHAASLLLSASSTMGSLARLTVALPSIAIPRTVSAAVDSALHHLQDTCDALRAGQFATALEKARVAETHAEKGFFEKSMVGQVYFPDEHKVAVYLPLLGPIGVPLIMSAVKEIKKLLAARRNRGPRFG